MTTLCSVYAFYFNSDGTKSFELIESYVLYSNDELDLDKYTREYCSKIVPRPFDGLKISLYNERRESVSFIKSFEVGSFCSEKMSLECLCQKNL